MTLKPKPKVFGMPDPIEAIHDPTEDVTIDTSEDEQRELLTDIERGAALAKLEREHAVMLQAIRRSQHYLSLVLKPGGLSAKDCLTGLLQTLDNDEINEVTGQ